MKNTNYAIRCYKNNKRKYTHKLSKKDALYFRETAKHLIAYLNLNYRIVDKSDKGMTQV